MILRTWFDLESWVMRNDVFTIFQFSRLTKRKLWKMVSFHENVARLLMCFRDCRKRVWRVTRWRKLISIWDGNFVKNKKKGSTNFYSHPPMFGWPLFEKVAYTMMSKVAWEFLEKSFQDVDEVNKIRLQSLMNDFEAMKMKQSESISNYFSRVKIIVNQSKKYEDKIEDVRMAEKIVRFLTPTFNYVVCVMEEWRKLL